MRMAREVIIRETHELQLLPPIDSLETLAGREALPRFDFDEREHAAAAHDEIDLAAAQPHTAAGNRVAAQPVKPGGAPFAAASQLLRLHVTEATSGFVGSALFPQFILRRARPGGAAAS